MKLIAIILSILTITLAALPCDDEVTDKPEQLVFSSQTSDNDTHDMNDLCSPFCICVCCFGVVIEPNIQQNILISEFSTTESNTYYTESFSIDFLTRIFQPPRV